MIYKLTDKDKKILNTFSMYLKSHGVNEAWVNFDIDTDGQHYFDFPNRWYSKESRLIIEGYDQITNFVEKLVNEELIDNILGYYDYEDRGTVDLFINAKEKELRFEGLIYKMSVDYESIARNFDQLEQEAKTYLVELGKKYRKGVISYQGGGDSGYVEDNITLDNEDIETVPETLIDSLYGILSNFGGWEINEGSQGEFQIDFEKEIIVVEHGSNYESSEKISLPYRYTF